MAKKEVERDFVEEIRDDSQYKKFKDILKQVRTKLNPEKDRNEALALHASRTGRTLYGKKQFSGKSIMEASMQDLANRARLVEIRVQASIQISLLAEAVKRIRRYIMTEYADELKAYSTQASRTAMVDRIIHSALETVAEGEALLELLDTLVKDLDQGGYSLRNCISVLQLLDSSKGKIV